MDFSTILTEGALFFQILIVMLYFKKQQFNDTRAKIFKYWIIITLIYLIIQLGFTLSLEIGISSTFSYILWKLCWVFIMIWWYISYLYCFVVSNNIKEENIFNIIKYDTERIIFFVFMALITVIAAFLPHSELYDYKSYEELSYLPGILTYAIPIITIIMLIFICNSIIKNIKQLDKATRFSLLFIVIDSIICITLQIIFDEIAFLAIGITADVFIIYSLLENPDIKFINEINEAKGDIEKSNQTKTDFLSNMTGEIKVPMNLIISLCDELISLPNFEEKLVREDISQIVSSGNSLIEIINNILDVSKLETGKVIIQEKDYKVRDLLTDVLNIAKSKIGNKQVKLIVNIDQNVSSVLNGDYSKIYQILVNILTNSIKYTDVGRVNFTLTSSKSGNNEKLLFKVSDTGIGIKDEDKDKIFIKGIRLANSKADEGDSGGLGLAISKQYVESLDGKIWFESQYRVGSTFFVDITQKIVDQTPIANALKEQAINSPLAMLDCSNLKALIVDDNLLNIKVAKRLLEKYKFQIDSVTSGKECIYKIKEGEHFDIIFMDHMMPEMDGIETLHVLKKLDGFIIPPIVALTANAVNGMKEMYMSEGFDEYLSKPIKTKELDRIINLFFTAK